MPAVTLRRISMKALTRYQIILLGEQRGTLGVNNLPRVVARIMRRSESNPRPLDHESSTLTTTPPSQWWPYKIPTILKMWLIGWRKNFHDRFSCFDRKPDGSRRIHSIARVFGESEMSPGVLWNILCLVFTVRYSSAAIVCSSEESFCCRGRRRRYKLFVVMCSE